ncbi:DegT/DnrJ/EryC1/StrS family aminotransferase [Candidatus Omnitrophota bacterium]
MLFRIIPRRKINLQWQDLKVFMHLLFKRELSQGKYTEIFEKAFADYIGTQYALAVSSGRIGLRLILESLRLDPGDEIILPAFTFNAVAQAIKDSGLEPIFVDVHPETYNIDPDLIEKTISPKTKALIATHIFGAPCDISKIVEIAGRNGLVVIEDCCQAIGAMFDERKVGTFGYCSFFSFESIKPFSTFGGGAIVTNDINLIKKVKTALAQYPYPPTKSIVKRFIFSIIEYFLTLRFVFAISVYPVLLLSSLTEKNLVALFKKTKSSFKRFETRFSNFQALIGLSRLPDLEKNNLRRISFAQLLAGIIKGNLKKQKIVLRSKPIFYSYAIGSTNGQDLSKKLLAHGIDVDWFSNHDCSGFCMEKERHPVAQQLLKTLSQLPLYHALSRKDIIYIAERLNKIAEN